jgi:hypothetical protein
MTYVLLAALADLKWIVWPVLSGVLVLGLVATFAPGRFSRLSARGSKWFDTDKLLQILEKPIDVDSHVLRYSRVFGVVVTLAAAWLAYVYWAHFMQ